MSSARPTLIERAFELAKSGECENLSVLRKQLHAEGYAEYLLVGPSLSRQLRDLCATAQREVASEP